MDGRLAGTLAGRGRWWLAWTEINFENDGLWNGKNVWNLPGNWKWWYSGTIFFAICENDMHRNGNLGLKNWGLSHGTYLICNTYKVPPGGNKSF